jgi:hypothetical protein
MCQRSDLERSFSVVGFTISLPPEMNVLRTLLEMIPIVLNTPGDGSRFTTGGEVIKYLDE